ncbi:MAG: DUF3316 domain-containing protein [Bacteroidales bacterium]
MNKGGICFFTVFFMLSNSLLAQDTLNVSNRSKKDFWDNKFPRISQHSISLGIVGTNIYTDYLSHLPYQGLQGGILYQGDKSFAKKLMQDWKIQIEGGGLHSPAKNYSYYSAMLHLHWGVLCPVYKHPNFQILVGGQLQTEIGGFYLPAYGNSAAVLNANISLNAAFRLDYKFFLGKQPMQLHYQLALPLLGLVFAPEYGMSYYEIFTKIYSPEHYLSFASVYNNFSMQNMVALDFVFKTVQLRFSYVGHSLWSNLKGIHSQWHGNAFYVGFVLNMVNMSGKETL